MSLDKSCEHAQPKSRIAIKENLVLASFSLVLEIIMFFVSVAELARGRPRPNPQERPCAE